MQRALFGFDDLTFIIKTNDLPLMHADHQIWAAYKS
jgi:hypothetical protein